MSKMEAVIENKLTQALDVKFLQIENESHMHSGPATDSHFKVTLVSDDFIGQRAVKRHQQIFAILADEMKNPIHALALHLFTQDEWQARDGQVAASPNCMGGSKADNG